MGRHHNHRGRNHHRGMRYNSYSNGACRFGRGNSQAGTNLERTLDAIVLSSSPASIVNGVYSLQANTISAIAQLDNSPLLLRTNTGPPVVQASITIIGNKTSPAGSCCQILTIMFGALLLFPLFFMCCQWWKKLVYPRYELNPEVFNSLAKMVRCAPDLKLLTLTIADSSFDHFKAGKLYQILSTSLLRGFTFRNLVLDADYGGREATDFRANMSPIKELPVTSSITWGDIVM